MILKVKEFIQTYFTVTSFIEYNNNGWMSKSRMRGRGMQGEEVAVTLFSPHIYFLYKKIVKIMSEKKDRGS